MANASNSKVNRFPFFFIYIFFFKSRHFFTNIIFLFFYVCVCYKFRGVKMINFQSRGTAIVVAGRVHFRIYIPKERKKKGGY